MQNSPEHSLPISIFIVILLFATLASIAADIYLPSLPAIARVFSASESQVQLTIFSFMLGYSLAHLVYGPWSDQIGRRSPLLTGMGLSILGTAICACATSIEILIFGRFLQGLGVASCNSVGRSLTRDLLSGSQLAKIGSYLGMIMIFFIATAPTIGGYIQFNLNWHWVFIFFLGYSIFVWTFTYVVLPETNTYLNPHATKILSILKNYLIVITNKTFLGYSLCVSCAYAGIIAYVTAAPFIFQNTLGLTPVQFGWLGFVVGGSVFISMFINSQFVVKQGLERMVLVGVCCMSLAGLLMLTFKFLAMLNVLVIIIPVAIFCIGAGFIFANASAGAFHPLPRLAGSVGALFGCIQISGGAISSALIAYFNVNDQSLLAWIFIILGLISFVSWRFLATHEKIIF